MAGGGEFLLGVGGFVERKFHVRRAGANPHVAHKDVLTFDSVLALHDERRRCGIGLERADFHLPAAQRTGQLPERGDAHLLSLKLDRHHLALVRPAPESQRQFALKNHVVGENSGQPHVRAHGERPQQQEQRCAQAGAARKVRIHLGYSMLPHQKVNAENRFSGRGSPARAAKRRCLGTGSSVPKQ